VIPPVVSSLTLNPTTVTGGVQNSTGTVTLNGPAPAGGAQVALSSSNPSVASVPASVTVPAGATTVTFTVVTSVVVLSQDVTITASYNGSSRSATLTVRLLPLL
jgi:plastocyanin